MKLYLAVAFATYFVSFTIYFLLMIGPEFGHQTFKLPLAFIATPDDLSVTEGVEVSLTPVVNGPFTSVVWRKDGIVHSEQQTLELSFQEAAVSDSGEYSVDEF